MTSGTHVFPRVCREVRDQVKGDNLRSAAAEFRVVPAFTSRPLKTLGMSHAVSLGPQTSLPIVRAGRPEGYMSDRSALQSSLKCHREVRVLIRGEWTQVSRGRNLRTHHESNLDLELGSCVGPPTLGLHRLARAPRPGEHVCSYEVNFTLSCFDSGRLPLPMRNSRARHTLRNSSEDARGQPTVKRGDMKASILTL